MLDLDWGEGLDELDFPLNPESPKMAEEEENPSPFLGNVDEDIVEENLDESAKDVEKENIPQEKQGEDVEQEIEKCSAPMKLRHVTMAEPLSSRSKGDVAHALTVILVRMRSLGIHVNRLHGDRAKELLSRNTEAWCAKHGLVRTLGGGDDPANNGHVESEVNQIKRRVRLLLRSAGQDVSKWPNALRFAVEERMRNQLEKLGVSTMPMIPYGSSVLVKRKRWHDAGVLAPPYVEGELLSPSPQMRHGWVVRTLENRIVHVREAIVPSSLGDEVALELKENSPQRIDVEEAPPARRIYGKQHPRNVERIPLPLPEVFGSVEQPASPLSMGFSFRDEGADYSPTSDEEIPVEPCVSSLSGGEPLGDGETLKTLPFLGEDEPPKGGKMDPSKYPKNGQKAGVSRDFLGSDGKSPKKAPLGDGETLKTLVEIGKQKCLGEPLGEKGSQGSLLGQKCLGEPLGENGSQGSLLGEKCLGEPLGENGSQGPSLGQKSLGESLGEKREPREIVRMMSLEDLEDMWAREHKGVTRELNRVLQLVPEDGDEGWTFGVVVGMFQGVRDVLENGLT